MNQISLLVPAAEAEEAKSSSPEVTAANEAVPPVSVEATAEPKAEPASRHTQVTSRI